MIITLAGMPGAGKTTIARMLKERLDLEHYYMGGIRRQIAKEKGMTIEEFNKLGETDPSTDKVVDDYLVELGKTRDDFIAEGRTAWYFIPDSIKIFMDVGWKEGAERIRDDLVKKGRFDERNETAGVDVDEQAELLRKRVESDSLRYKKYYGIDVLDRSHYDLVIDTACLSIDEVYKKIEAFIKERCDADAHKSKPNH